MDSSAESADALLQRVLSGDRPAWEEWVRRTAPIVYRMAALHLHARGYPAGAETIEKVAAEVFRGIAADSLRILRELKDGPVSLETWLGVRTRALCRETCLSAAAAASPPASPPEAPPENPVAAQAEEAFARLSSKDRLIVRLLTHNRLKYTEVALAVKAPPKGVGLAIVRLKDRIRRGLGAQGRTIPDEVKI